MKAICDECGKEFEIRASEYRKNTHHYCSRDCRCKVLRDTFLQNFRDRVGHKYVLVEYVDKDNVTVECKQCGNRFTRTSSKIVRMGCPHCKEIRTKLNQAKRQMLKAMNASVRSKRKELDKIAERLSVAMERAKRKDEMDKHRAEKRREENKVRELRREQRIKNNGVFDRDITVDKLFIRDNGVCSLCGGMCDYRDSTTRNGHFIVGEKYPSIDHVIPLSKGGTHTWDNVKLAHFKCNTLKGNKTIPRVGSRIA